MKAVLTYLLILSSLLCMAQSEAVVKKNNSGLTKMEFPNNNSNLLIGESTGSTLNNGFRNVLLGNYTGIGLVNGSDNTLVGVGAGNITSGSGNVALGYNAGQSSTGDFNVFLGREAGFNAGPKSNTLWIENAVGDSTQALIYGEFDNDKLIFNAHTDIYSDDTVDEGLYVKKTHAGDSDVPAITGDNTVADFWGIGVRGNGGYVGVQGNCIGTGSGTYYGTAGNSYSANSGTNIGVFGGASEGTTNYGIYGYALGGQGNFAGYFDGKVQVTDTLVLSDKGIELEADKVIKKATTMKYFIALEGTFPSNGGPFADGILLGEIKLFPYINLVPGGWHECDGTLLNIADYQALFSLIGVEYGGDGFTTFALPDMREAVPHHGM